MQNVSPGLLQFGSTDATLTVMSKVKERRRAAYPEIVRLKSLGMKWLEIGRELGVAGTTARRWFYETLAEERKQTGEA